jgi:hypothetical protein
MGGPVDVWDEETGEWVRKPALGGGNDMEDLLSEMFEMCGIPSL